MSEKSRAELLEEAKKLQRELEIKEELPHLFRIKKYRWMLQYEASNNKMKFICAGNQVGKSTIQIIHAIDLATDKKKWKKFFKKREPQVFWYIYPSKAKIQEEFKEKWVTENLPKGSMKEHHIYGWEKFNIDGEFAGIKFNSGVSIYFKSWGMDLQAGTADYIFADEELPEDIYPELAMRTTATDGSFSMVFTATLNQAFWFDVMERRGKPDERFPQAFKLQVSMEHDCRFFADGTPSHFTEEVINKRKNSIGDPTEIERRIHGRFVSAKGKKFVSFNKIKNVKPKMIIPRDWDYFAGVDIGAGGKDCHPAAISIIAVRPDYRYARLVKFWRGGKDKHTDTSDILNQYVKMSAGLPMTKAFYDWHSKEFFIRAQKAGIPFEKAEKSHTVGDDLLNILFKNQMLDLEEGEQIVDLIQEIESLRHDKRKTDAIDDGVDSLRYSLASLNWDLSGITDKLIDVAPEVPREKLEWELRAEAGERMLKPKDDEGEQWNIDKEYDDFNDMIEDYYGE